MQQKWTFFAIGIMAGVIAVLATMLLMQPRESHAANAAQDSAQQAGIVMGTGGSQQNFTDVVWILHKRPAPKKAGADTSDITNKDERLTLCAYQVGNNAKTIRLVGVRDVSFDMDLIEYKNEAPTVKEIVEALKKQQKKND